MKAARLGLVVLLALAAFSIARGMRAPARIQALADSQPAQAALLQPQPQQAIARQPKLAVAFRLDPELTQGMYLGERWVTPDDYFFAQPGKQYVVQAKAQDIGSDGQHVDLGSDWAASDPAMVAVTRGDAGKVTIVVRHPGESDLTVTSLGRSKVLHVRANQVADGMQVEITQ